MQARLFDCMHHCILTAIQKDSLRRNWLCWLADWKSRRGASVVLGNSLWDSHRITSFITHMTGNNIPCLSSGELDCERIWVTDPQGGMECPRPYAHIEATGANSKWLLSIQRTPLALRTILEELYHSKGMLTTSQNMSAVS